MCLYKGNLPTEYELIHKFIVYQVGKRSKRCQSLTTLNDDKVQSNVSVQRQLTYWVWVIAPVHSGPIGKKSKRCQSLTTLNADKVQSNVSVQRQLTSWVWVNATVHSVPSWEKEQNMSITHNTQSSLRTDRCMCPYKGNWVWVSAPVHSIPSWEKIKEQKMSITHNTQCWQGTVKCVCTKATYFLSMS